MTYIPTKKSFLCTSCAVVRRLNLSTDTPSKLILPSSCMVYASQHQTCRYMRLCRFCGISPATHLETNAASACNIPWDHALLHGRIVASNTAPPVPVCCGAQQLTCEPNSMSRGGDKMPHKPPSSNLPLHFRELRTSCIRCLAFESCQPFAKTITRLPIIQMVLWMSLAREAHRSSNASNGMLGMTKPTVSKSARCTITHRHREAARKGAPSGVLTASSG